MNAYQEADVYSKHNLLNAKFQLKLKKINTKINRDKIDINKLKITRIKEKLKQKINKNLWTPQTT